MLYTKEAINNRKKKANRLKKAVNALLYILLIPLLVYNIILIAQAIIKPNETPNFFGIKTYVIISGSMEPNYRIGDIVVVKDTENLQIGDVISFRQGHSIITHRIIDITEDNGKIQYLTKGDSNNATDSGKIENKLVEGKVIGKVPFLGKITLLLQGKIAIILVILIIYSYLSYSGKLRKRKENRREKRIKHERRKIEK